MKSVSLIIYHLLALVEFHEPTTEKLFENYTLSWQEATGEKAIKTRTKKSYNYRGTRYSKEYATLYKKPPSGP